MQNTKIGWADTSWNPVSGCTKVSPGCDNCYAETLAERYRGTKAFPNGFDVTLRPHKLNEPKKWKKPSRCFVNSMSDFWHKDIPDDFIRSIWNVMVDVDRHVYQILTKRPRRMLSKIESLGLPMRPHIWLGVSVESQNFAKTRIPDLLKTDAPIKFLSCEPLLGPVDISEWTQSLQWVITGGESGSNRRPADYDWFRQIRDNCIDAGVAFFHKQGNAYKSDSDQELDGQLWQAYPNMEAQHKEQLSLV